MPDQILNIATPGFIILMVIEILWDKLKNGGYYRVNDSFGSLATGILSQSYQLVFFSLGLWALAKLSQVLDVETWPSSSVVAWVAAFILYDFIYYMKHRLSHEVNMFWAGHVVHHQSEEYNLSTALRQPSTTILLWFLSVPLILLGISWQMIAVCAAWNLIYQFWVHTRYIKRLPAWYEWLMVTPSNHRVHHAQNSVYIDRNYGGVFILWDRLFGTFQAELDQQPVIFGVRKAVASFNPWQANFQVWWSLLRDAWRTASWKDKLRIWFMPTGWRPADMQQRFPIEKTDLTRFKKYNPACSKPMAYYAVAQIIFTAVAGLILVAQVSQLSGLQMLLAWLCCSWPLLTAGAMLNHAGLRWEFVRLVVSWVVFVANSALIPGTYWWLVLATLAISSLAVLFVTGPKAEPVIDAA